MITMKKGGKKVLIELFERQKTFFNEAIPSATVMVITKYEIYTENTQIIMIMKIKIIIMTFTRMYTYDIKIIQLQQQQEKFCKF